MDFIKNHNLNRRQIALAVASYLGPVSLLSLYLSYDTDKFVTFHVKQGLALFFVEMFFMLFWFIPFIGQVIAMLAFIFCGIYSLAGAVSALSGLEIELPFLRTLTRYIEI